MKAPNCILTLRNSEIMDSDILVPETGLHRRTWYSNSGAAREKTDHVHVGSRLRLLQNGRVFPSTEFAGTDHRFPVATLKIRLKSRKMAPSNQVRLDVRRLRDESVTRSTSGNLWKVSANLTISTILRNSAVTSRPKSCRCLRAVCEIHLERKNLSDQGDLEPHRGEWQGYLPRQERTVPRAEAWGCTCGEERQKGANLCRLVVNWLSTCLQKNPSGPSGPPPCCWLLGRAGANGTTRHDTDTKESEIRARMGWLLRGIVSCGPNDREFPGDVEAVRDVDPLLTVIHPT